ncbi:glycosyltransferase [Floridanema aerugineum]|jgi:glycosyltransferase involved in cell wall biosynthesis|uniref:Glycosyltransferase n=1 Tax=Floridaenema aerugineum BLCC-F46 TaxID=3153654 RepID=A0ABV4XHP0_9CYAN
MPTISVIIPVYNGEKTIQQTIESVINQTFTDFEIIIINDGSKDSTLDIISTIQDPRIKVFSYANAGLSASRNRGLSLASGEFISFLDADDCWTPDKLQAQLEALQANPEAAVAYSWTDYIDEYGQVLRSGTRISVSGNVYEKLLVRNFLENGSNALIRRQALTEVGNFDESLTAAEDWDMYVRLASRYHFVVVRSPQILYRVSTSSMSTNVAKQEAASLQVIERAFNQAPESLQHLKKYALSTLYIYLTFKVLENPSGRQNALTAARYLRLAVKSDRSVLKRQQTMLKALFKILVVLLMPMKQSQALVNQAKNLFKNFNQLGK